MQRIKCLSTIDMILFKCFLKENIPEEEMRNMIREMDKTGEGEISFKEFS